MSACARCGWQRATVEDPARAAATEATDCVITEVANLAVRAMCSPDLVASRWLGLSPDAERLVQRELHRRGWTE